MGIVSCAPGSAHLAYERVWHHGRVSAESHGCGGASPWYVPLRLIGLVMTGRFHVGELVCHALLYP